MMYKICRVETATVYTDDNFTTYEEALDMAMLFVADDMDADEPPYTYVVLNENDQLLAMLRDGSVFEIKK